MTDAPHRSYVDLIRRALDQRPDIRPDSATAAAIGWEGQPWLTSGSRSTGTDEGDESGEQDASFILIADAPSEDEDRLDRGPYALFLARRLHHIWHTMNGGAATLHSPTYSSRAGSRESNTFILHVDAPWGGGKTTFANFVARVLQPTGERITEHHFLYPCLEAEELRSPLDILGPKSVKEEGAPRRPWVIARYNAWRDQSVQPPWWQIFCTIESAVDEALVREQDWEPRSRIWLTVQNYKLGNSKLRSQLVVGLLFALFLLILAASGALSALWTSTSGDPERIAKIVAAVVGILGFGGASIAALLTAISQSLDPDLDFTTESKQVGIRDPISRFRAMFDRTLELAGRPVLLIVDDIDRCDPRTVVEIMRGFQTVVRSSRLFVMLLGDRAWIEAAHDLYHKEMGTIADPESSLGAQFVRKVIQLSFRLPLMSEAARAAYTRYILASGETEEQPQQQVTTVLENLNRELHAGSLAKVSVAEREAKIERAAGKARTELARQGHASENALIDRIAAIKQVVAASEDAEREAKLSQTLTRLFARLPNNPRQMKRIVMAFGVYETVGRIYYQYRQTPTGENGDEKAKRWRQLAIWITLATEWPATWRALARRPELLVAAYGAEADRAKLATAMTELPEEERRRLHQVIHRLRTDPTISALVQGVAEDAALEEQAIYEFNRIIWEAGFKLEADLETAHQAQP